MKLLIVEDDAISGKLLQKQVEGLGYENVLARDGEEAWNLFQAQNFRVVITDWMMPKMNGLELCRKIRSSSKDYYTYIIIITAKDNKQDFLKAFESGADDFIVKPFDPEEIKARTRTAERIGKLEEDYQDLQDVLIESRNKLRVVFDALTEQVVAVDRDYQIASINNAFMAGRDMDFGEIMGANVFADGILPGDM